MNTNPPSRPTNTYAIISLVCGILGWTLFPLLGSLLAIVFGHMARTGISRDPHQDGDGMALAGLILGYASVLVSVLAFIFIVLFFGGFFAFMATL